MLSWWFLSSSRMSSVESTSTTAQRVSPPGSSLDAPIRNRPTWRQRSVLEMAGKYLYIYIYMVLYGIILYMYYYHYYYYDYYYHYYSYYYICIIIYMNYPINVGFDVCISFQQCGFWRAIVGLRLIEVIWRKLWSHCGWWGACKILQGRGWFGTEILMLAGGMNMYYVTLYMYYNYNIYELPYMMVKPMTSLWNGWPRHPMDDLFREIVDYQRRVGKLRDGLPMASMAADGVSRLSPGCRSWRLLADRRWDRRTGGVT